MTSPRSEQIREKAKAKLRAARDQANTWTFDATGRVASIATKPGEVVLTMHDGRSGTYRSVNTCAFVGLLLIGTDNRPEVMTAMRDAIALAWPTKVNE
jgi:hypothetical protein